MAGTAKSRYCAEQNLLAFFGRHPVVFYWTWTFAENIEDKELAEARFKPLLDKLRRMGAEELHFWERQKRGAWHVHLVTQKYLDVGWVRPFMVRRGWGPIMKAIRVESHVQYVPGEGWKREDSGEQRLVRYLIKYLTKAWRDSDMWKKPCGGSASAKMFTTSFRWVPYTTGRASCYLFHMGKQYLAEIGQSIDLLCSDVWSVTWKKEELRAERAKARFARIRQLIHLGYEVTGWGNFDPFYLLP